ncbi:MAG: bifunctional (p)ppGpp synthetase/guanosine-3',5'-bis(diphosphate) 3'-pyrophosphohydrolase [Candidatus Melainabacteria bacterium]|nr:bifunctional (p)ppGpp synthetase/guanosine-3',5'-bis(diphosphate) 3'-pyrophosphohydrolase [Candidatus Melainabacteria bacterium]
MMPANLSNANASESNNTPLPEDLLFADLLALLKKREIAADQLTLVEKTYEFSRFFHKGQLRKDGGNYITHPVSVALILAPMYLDIPTIQAAILHDVLEDTPCTPTEMKQAFGEDVLKLVQGVTKLGRYKFQSKEDQQAENFRNMFLAMAEDIRVITLKLADRLHNMRTLEHMRADKQKRIAEETIGIFAPLANRIGMGNFKAELEDLSLQYIDAEGYIALDTGLTETREEREENMKAVIAKIEAQLVEAQLEGRVYGRLKNHYSIYKKMQFMQKELKDIFDISAVRVIIPTESNCYEVLGLIHHVFTPVAGRFKDYIAMPKSNFYQSLHTTIIGPNKRPVEVQIRTQQMHEIAEFGIAAHFHYKKHAAGGGGANVPSFKGSANDEKLSWLKQIIEMQNETPNAKEFVENVKLDLFPDQVFVFTPKGLVISLPKGSTPIDFAFRIHTEIGYRCAGSVVNEKMVPLDTELQNGDIVEVITNKKASPRLDWVNVVATQHAKTRIRQWYKKHYKAQHEQQGRQLLEADLTRAGLDALIKSGQLAEVAKELNYITIEDLYAGLGYGELGLARVVNRLKKNGATEPAGTTVKSATPASEKTSEKTAQEAFQALTEALHAKKSNATHFAEMATKTAKRSEVEASQLSKNEASLKALKGLQYHIAKCCMPVPGDAITGIVTRSRGVMIHRDDCINTLQANPARMMCLDGGWNGAIAMKETLHQVAIDMQVMDRVGVLKEILSKIADENVNVDSAKCHRSAEDRSVFIEIGVEVRHLEELERILVAIRKLPDVVMVKRSHYRLNKTD